MMSTEGSLDVYRRHLPPYRLLLNPNVQYDYLTHRFVQLSPTDIMALSQALEHTGNHTLLFLTLKYPAKPQLGLMKYRLLLSDVGRSLSRIGRRPTPTTTTNLLTTNLATGGGRNGAGGGPTNFLELPSELTEYIVYLVDDPQLWRSCMDCCKQLYAVAKPYFYQDLAFTLTYRFAQFITYLRVNPRVGEFVERIDLAGIAPGIDPEELDTILSQAEGLLFLEALAGARAGWRDWKFANNPLYSRPPVPLALAAPAAAALTLLTKTVSNDTTVTTSLATLRSFRFFKRRKRSRLAPPIPILLLMLLAPDTPAAAATTTAAPRRRPAPVVLDLRQPRPARRHPRINKYLVDYATSKDIPAGYIIHLLNLCPNLVLVNLAGLSISPDYEVAPQRAALKYQTFDTMNNCHKYVSGHLEMLNGLAEIPLAAPDDLMLCALLIRTQLRPRYMSLLTPTPAPADAMYCKRGDGRVFLSDLSVKAINRDNLVPVPELAVLETLATYGRRSHRIHYVNLSLMVWLNKQLVLEFLRQFVASVAVDEVDEWFELGARWREPDLDDDDADDTERARREIRAYRQPLVLDLTDLGMYKLLPWATCLDLMTYEGCRLVRQISGDGVPDPFQEFLRRERLRRGRVGENYFGG